MKKKTYKKPEIKKVKLFTGEAVMTGCKTSTGDGAGNSGKGCAHPRCSKTIGS